MRRRWYQNLTVQVLCAVAIGITIGMLWPDAGQALKPLADGFIRLVKMVVGPIVFLTIVLGISSMGDLKKVGRVGGKALIYFEVVTTIALVIGLVVAHLIRPGAGLDPAKLATAAAKAQAEQFTQTAKHQSPAEFVLHVIPDNVTAAFANGELLQILFFAVLVGVAMASLGKRVAGLRVWLESATEVMFRIVRVIMYVAPLGALGAMAFTVGSMGADVLKSLVLLMACVYLTMAVFIFGVLGLIARLFGFSLWRYLVFIREEIVLVLGTSSSESALPRMIERMEMFGCGRRVVDLVIPTGYSFNLDGTSIYLSMAVLFIAQAYGVEMGLGKQIGVLGVLMLTSKGAAAVTGAGFVTLAATLSATRVLPPEGLALVFGVDRFMSEARAITNLIGNGVAAVVVSKMEGEFDETRYRAAVGGREVVPRTVETEGDLGEDAVV